MKQLKQGDFCWVELGTSNLEAAQKFYTDLFNWETTSNDTEFGPYLMMKVKEDDLAGAYQVSPEMKSQGVPCVWSSYILVDDVAKTTEKARELGAQILREPMDVINIGKMSIFADPTGAVISLWEAKNSPSRTVDGSVTGVPSWFELMTTDAKKARDFYSKLLGWVPEKMENTGPFEYTVFKNNNNGIAGMFEITEDMQGVPPHWGIYFTVNNFDSTIEKAKKMGANFLYEPKEVEGVGRFVGIQDPQGVIFSVIQHQR